MKQFLLGLFAWLAQYSTAIFLCLVLFLLSFPLLFKTYLPNQIAEIQAKITQQQYINLIQTRENQHLAKQIELIKSPNSAILESQARTRLGLIKPNETYYQYE